MTTAANLSGPHRAWRLGADIDTDQLAPGTYMKLSLPEIATHCLEGLRPEQSIRTPYRPRRRRRSGVCRPPARPPAR